MKKALLHSAFEFRQHFISTGERAVSDLLRFCKFQVHRTVSNNVWVERRGGNESWLLRFWLCHPFHTKTAASLNSFVPEDIPRTNLNSFFLLLFFSVSVNGKNISNVCISGFTIPNIVRGNIKQTELLLKKFLPFQMCIFFTKQHNKTQQNSIVWDLWRLQQ